MSSPTDRPIDPRDALAYAPKWARDRARAERRIVAQQHCVSELDEDEFFGRDSAEASPSDGASATQRPSAPPPLDPIVLPPPPSRSLARFPFGGAGGLAISAAAAAMAALFVVGNLPPWSVVAKDESAQAASFDSWFFERTTPLSNIDRENFPPASHLAGFKIAVESADEEVGEALPGSAPEHVASTRTEPASPAPRLLDPDEIAVLLNRGQELVATGDLTAARVVLLRAAEAHDPMAALALAATFDPIMLKKLGVYGVAGDISSAWRWYERAKEFGSEEAPRRLEMLASREQ
jgi:hypothetical protein